MKSRTLRQSAIRNPKSAILFEPLESRMLMSTIVVNSASDVIQSGDGQVTLREAIVAANTDASTDLGQRGNGADTILFNESLRGQTIRLGLGSLTIDSDLVIQGLGASDLTIDANHLSRIFNITDGNVELRGMTLTGGSAVGEGVTDLQGGAIYLYAANLTVADAVITGNVARYGGAIGTNNSYFNYAYLHVINSTISDNTAEYAGGAYGENITFTNTTITGNTATVSGAGGVAGYANTFTNCTISGNNSVGAGGGVAGAYSTFTSSTIYGNTAINGAGGGVVGYANTFTNTTISGNTATFSAAVTTTYTPLPRDLWVIDHIYIPSGVTTYGFGGGVHGFDNTFTNSTIAFNHAVDGAGIYATGTLTLRSTIVGSNGGPAGVVVQDITRAGGTVNADHSLIQNAVPGTVNGTNEANLFGVDPMLAPLADNGGPTFTHALYAGSPAINKGSNSLNLAYDQRGPGFPRVVNGTPDIGSFEGTTNAPIIVVPPIVPPSLGTGGITVTPTSGLVTTESGGTASFSVSLQSQPLAPVTITVDTGDSTEGLVSAGLSAPASSVILTFTPEDWGAQIVTVTGVDDAATDGDVAYTVRTQAAVSVDPRYNGLNGADVSVVNRDNDLPSLSIGDYTASEGKSGNKSFTFIVTLSQPATQTVTVNYATANSTATTADSDYTAKSGTLTFSPGQTSKTITVSVKGDTKVETDETFYVNLLNSVNATIGDGQGVGTIVNDDTAGGGGSAHGNSAKSAQASGSSTQEAALPKKKQKKLARQPAAASPNPVVVAPPDSVDLLAMTPAMAMN